jgi:glycosyltransferase involved in cell wall biosynthesis
VKLALVASSYLPHRGVLERFVHELASGLTARGVEVEVLTQDPDRKVPAVSEFDGFLVRRFVVPFGNSQLAVAPGLWEHLRRTATSFDLVHAHGAPVSLAVAAARARPLRLMFTPHVPVQRILHGRYAPVTRALIGQGAHFICTATTESTALKRAFPHAAHRIGFVPIGVDLGAIQSARPFTCPGPVVLTVGPLERYKRVDRVIAAMAGLDSAFRLAVIGDGPARERLVAHAGDLRVSMRVNFVGSVPDAELHRWLRTARVVVALAEEDASGLHVTEGLCAGAGVVASDIAVHREAAADVGGAGVKFVAPIGSPLEVADAIHDGAAPSTPRTLRHQPPSWDDTVERILVAYRRAIGELPRIAVAGR